MRYVHCTRLIRVCVELISCCDDSLQQQNNPGGCGMITIGTYAGWNTVTNSSLGIGCQVYNQLVYTMVRAGRSKQ